MYSKEFQEKVQLFLEAARFENKTVPNLSNDYTWKISDSGCSYKEAYFNHKKMKKVVCENHERYNYDAYLDLGTRNHFPQMQALGSGSYVLNEETGAINVTDEPTLQPEEYGEFAKNPMAWFNILFQRKVPNLKTEDFVKATMAFLQGSGYAKDIAELFATKYSRPAMVTTSASVQPAYELFHSSLRGIAGVATDMRRHKEALLEACESYWNVMGRPALQRALSAKEKNYIADVYFAIIGHAVMNRKQFETFYWPQAKEILETAAAAGKLTYIYVESNIDRFAEYFADVPKGSAIMHLELDDIFAMRQALPDMALAGGMTTNVLGGGTKEECVDLAKKLVEELGAGYVMSQNKMLSFKNDCKRENQLAVNEYIRSVQL